jgi:hypothetical protein
MGKKKNQKKGEEPSTTETGGEDQASTSKIDDQQDAPATEHVEGVPPKIVLYCEGVLAVIDRLRSPKHR